MLVRHLTSILAVGMVLSFAPETNAQQLGSKEDLDKGFKDFSLKRSKILSGDELSNDKSLKSTAEGAAQYFIFRITHRTIEPSKVQADFANQLAPAFDPKVVEKKKRPFIDALAPELAKCMAEVFDRDIKVDPSTVIHAAQMLPTMARLKHPAVNAYLIELIGDAKTHDVVRLHALKAMEKVMPARQQLDMLIANAKLELEDFKSKEQTAERQYHVKNVVALCNFIEEPMTKSDPDAIATRRFLRREAIIALAKAEVPAVTAHPKAIDKKLDGLVAPTFIRVIAKAGGLQPAPTLQEKIEAALGLCAMQYPNMPEYNADLGVYFVGQTMLEFVNDYSKDWLNFTNGGAGKKLPKIAYKTEAKRFQTGLKQLKDHASANREFAHKNTRQMAIDLDALTGKLMLAKIITLTAFDGERVQELDAFLTKSRPKDEYPFKSLKGPKVPLD